MAKPQRINTCNAFALRQATRYVSQLYDKRLAPVGLTGPQFSLLAQLEGDGLTMVELSRLLVTDRTTLVRTLQPLQRDGLVAATPKGRGSRQLILTLTAEGRDRLKAALPLWREAQDAFEGRVGLTEAENLRRQLLKLTQHI